MPGDNLLERFSALFQSYKQQFYEYNVYTLCLKLLGESIEKRVAQWRSPEQQLATEHHFIAQLMNLLKEVFVFRQAQSMQ